MEMKAYTFAFFLFSFSLPQSGTLIEWKPTTRKKVKVESKKFLLVEDIQLMEIKTYTFAFFLFSFYFP
jgi:hypothetical protein